MGWVRLRSLGSAIVFLSSLLAPGLLLAQAEREKILLVAAEQTGVFNTGGLGHTVAGLAKALKRSGSDVEVLMPYYSDAHLKMVAQAMRVDHSWDRRIPEYRRLFEVLRENPSIMSHTQGFCRVLAMSGGFALKVK